MFFLYLKTQDISFYYYYMSHKYVLTTLKIYVDASKDCRDTVFTAIRAVASYFLEKYIFFFKQV